MAPQSQWFHLAPPAWQKFMIQMKDDPRLVHSQRMENDPDFAQDVADGSIFFDRQLEMIDARMFEVKFAPLKARQFLPVKSDAGWASFEVYQILESYGAAKQITDYSSDLPSAEVDGREVSAKVIDWAIAYRYNIREFSRARELGLDLDASKAVKALNAIERKIDEIAATGDSVSGLEGIISHSAITPANVANGAAGTPAWTTKTADEIIVDFASMIATMRSTSKELHSVNQILIPTAQFDYIRGLVRSTQSDVTVLDFVRRNYPEIAFESWHLLDAQGAGATQRMIAMERNPENAELSIPVEPLRLDPLFKPLMTEIPVLVATAGVLLRRPLSVIYRDAI